MQENFDSSFARLIVHEGGYCNDAHDHEGWTTTTLGAEQVAALEANIDAQIQQQITPTSVNLLPPWSA